ncbi:MAG: DUF3565 domain-containing protein [Gammaproteobacteria bacterium]|nr:DUF3565 domain-containing protein [Gammaproteobacteria bacterium]
MDQKITGFHQDELQHWVADLACGHTQHVRHEPPWQSRPWVILEQGRQERIGFKLDCVECDKEKSSGLGTA